MWFKTVLSSKTFPQTDYYLSQYYIYIIARKGAVALANIFCWAAALLYAQMGAKSVVISPHPL